MLLREVDLIMEEKVPKILIPSLSETYLLTQLEKVFSPILRVLVRLLMSELPWVRMEDQEDLPTFNLLMLRLPKVPFH